MKITQLLPILLLCCLSVYAQFNYEFNQKVGSSCVPFAPYECVQCGGVYYSAHFGDTGNYGFYAKYSDPNCSQMTQGFYDVGVSECSQMNTNCSIFLNFASVSYYTATFSTSSSLTVSSYPGETSPLLALTLAKTTAELKGLLKYTEVKTPSTRLFFEELISPQLYSTNLGVFNFGTTYTKGDLTFKINRIANQTTPFMNAAPPDYAVVLAPFTTVQVVNTAQYQIDIIEESVLLVNTDTEYDLSGLIISFFNQISFQNIGVYPPAYPTTAAHFVGEYANEFWTFPCYTEENIIECSFSFSLSITSSILLDQPKEDRNVDDMSFSLF